MVGYPFAASICTIQGMEIDGGRLGKRAFTVRNVGWLACGRHDEHSLSRSVQGVWYKELVTENEQYKSHISRWGLYL